jgi:hypothetical protein
VALAYVIGFAVMLAVHPWMPDAPHNAPPASMSGIVRGV